MTLAKTQKTSAPTEDIIRNILDAVILIDPKGTITLANDAACYLLGYGEDSLLQKPIDSLFLGESPFHERRADESILRRYIISVEVSLRHKNGHGIPALFSSSAFLNKGGRVQGLVCVAQDITERKKVEKQLQNTQDQLYNSAKMELIGRLAAGAAHEVKNPLAIILQGVQFLQTTLPKDNAEMVSLLEYMRDAVQRADTVIRGLLDVAGSSLLKKTEENINLVIEKCLILIKNAATKKKVQISHEQTPDLPNITIDRNKIQQVFINLFMNAIEAMPSGEKLMVRPFKKEESLIIEIENTGSHIPEDILDKIFEPFFTTKRGSGGTGLGMPIVKSMVEMHKGMVTIGNRGGSVVTTITLPLLPLDSEKETLHEKNSTG